MITRVPRVSLGSSGYTISRLIIGGWQLSKGHREASIDEDSLFEDLARMARAGMTTLDVADIYSGVEERIGRFSARNARSLREDGVALQVHTKFVPDRRALPTLQRTDIEQSIDRSLRRLQRERLDLVQFAWWDYEVHGYVEAALALTDLQRAGKIRHLGVTNFDVVRTQELLDAGVPIVANQVQYSLLDQRPEKGMVTLAKENGFGLLCYGALAGGFLSGHYRNRTNPPQSLPNRSLVKYRLIIDEIGGWEAYQQLLGVLHGIAQRHQVAVSAIALAFVLDRPQVLATMIGTFHGQHLEDNLTACGVALTPLDRAEIDSALGALRNPPGDVFELERETGGPHASIMWTDLNRDG